MTKVITAAKEAVKDGSNPLHTGIIVALVTFMWYDLSNRQSDMYKLVSGDQVTLAIHTTEIKELEDCCNDVGKKSSTAIYPVLPADVPKNYLTQKK